MPVAKLQLLNKKKEFPNEYFAITDIDPTGEILHVSHGKTTLFIVKSVYGKPNKPKEYRVYTFGGSGVLHRVLMHSARELKCYSAENDEILMIFDNMTGVFDYDGVSKYPVFYRKTIVEEYDKIYVVNGKFYYYDMVIDNVKNLAIYHNNEFFRIYYNTTSNLFQIFMYNSPGGYFDPVVIPKELLYLFKDFKDFNEEKFRKCIDACTVEYFTKVDKVIGYIELIKCAKVDLEKSKTGIEAIELRIKHYKHVKREVIDGYLPMFSFTEPA